MSKKVYAPPKTITGAFMIYLAGLIFYEILPAAGILFFNGDILRKIRKPSLIMSDNEQFQRNTRNRSTIRLLFWIVLVFMFFSVIPRVAEKSIFLFSQDPEVNWFWLLTVIWMMIVFNSSVNIFIYVIVGKSFRNVIINKFCMQEDIPENIESIHKNKVNTHINCERNKTEVSHEGSKAS